ncbi:DUF7278 family profilin-like fold-containing protein [Enterococcus sp.]|uniref:DUF7278 family profilin-like fold-containing protein n=1 Tax=Enterococcus sp. TaxID=35783 RepID=UPI002FC612FD
MTFFEALEWINWKNLSKELRAQVMNQVLMYFVSPLKYISDVDYCVFELAGVKCETFECTIDDERFVLVPGNQEAILGWNFGTQGLPVGTWDQECQEASDYYLKITENYDLKTTEDWDTFVNESTSPLRKVSIPPMLVQKNALPAGGKAIGELNLITGEFSGVVEDFLPIEEAVRAHFLGSETLEDCLKKTHPSEIFEENLFYAKWYPDSDTYHIFKHQSETFHTLKEKVQAELFDLLDEDAWEYALGAGTRKLFRGRNYVEQRPKTLQANMFGLTFSTDNDYWEVIDSPYLKLEKMEYIGIPLFDALPLATYYRSRKLRSNQEALSPVNYSYRKAIIIRPT